MQYGANISPVKLTRIQFPIKIAFTLTINRLQG